MSDDNRPSDAAELRQHAEGARRVGEDEFRCIFERSHLGMSITQPSGEAQVNPAFCALLGYSPDEARQRNWQSFTHPDDVVLTQRLVDLLLAGEQVSGRLTKRFIHRNGSVVWVDLNSTLHRDESGEPLHFVTIMIDITDHKRNEAVLRESERKYRELVEHANSIILHWTQDGLVTFLNEFGLRFFGYSEAGVIGQHVVGTIVPATESTGRDLRPLMDQICANPQAFEHNINENMRRNGEKVWIAWTNRVSFDDQGQVTGILSIGTDITQRKQAEEALRQSELKYRRLHETMTDAFVLVDMTGHILECNQSYRDMLGRTDAELRQLTYPDISPERWHAFEARIVQEQILPHGFSGVYEKEYRRKDGVVFPVELRTSLIRDAAGQPAGMWAIIRDITERKRAEEALRESEKHLRQSEKMEAIGQLAGGVAHDFNNQLGGIVSCAELLLAKAHDEEARSCIESIIRLCGRSADLTSKLLAFSRQGKYQTAPVNMHTIVAEVVSLLGRSIDKRIGIRQRLDAIPPTTTGDPTQLQNVLINLGLNARDAMPAGGELLFATDAVTLDDEFCGKSGFDIGPGDFLRITVTDSGVGMDEKTQARLFEPFFTTKEPGKGTGLGLASVHGTVVNHHGAISVDSEVGKGTTMTIHLPLLRQEVQVATKRGDAVAKATASARILLVDDEEIVREFTARLLRRKGHKVVTASDGAEAVEYYGRSWQHIDLVILDMNMPKMNGSDAFIAMQKVNPHIRAILATGYGLDSNVQGMLDGGVVSWIHCPV